MENIETTYNPKALSARLWGKSSHKNQWRDSTNILKEHDGNWSSEEYLETTWSTNEENPLVNHIYEDLNLKYVPFTDIAIIKKETLALDK